MRSVSYLKTWFMTHIQETFYGKDGVHRTPYLTRVFLTPHMRWGHLVFHIAWRGDKDPDPHDHPAGFWTFPLTSYVEEVMDAYGLTSFNVVERFKWHYRPATYSHRLLGPLAKKPQPCLRWTEGRIYTIVWWEPGKRPWGFWQLEHDEKKVIYLKSYGANIKGSRRWVPWRRYVYGSQEDVAA